MATKPPPNAVVRDAQAKHNIDILKIMMKEFGIAMPDPKNPVPKAQLETRLQVYELIVSVLLDFNGSLSHADVMSAAAKKTQKALSSKAMGFNKMIQCYPLINPIVTFTKSESMAHLSPVVMQTIRTDKLGYWVCKEQGNSLLNEEGEALESLALIKEKIKDNSQKISLKLKENLKKSGDNTAGKSVSEPPSKVARIEPSYYKPTLPLDPKHAEEKAAADKVYETFQRHLRVETKRMEADKSYMKNVYKKNKQTMTRPDWFQETKGTNTKTWSALKDDMKWTTQVDQFTKKLKTKHDRVFHCTICDRIPKHHVVLDARCGQLVACYPCLKDRRETKKLKNCLQCGHPGKYIILKHLHEKLQRMT